MSDDPDRSDGVDEEPDHAAEELITGDSDDRPLREEVVAEMLRNEPAQRLGRE